MSRPIRFAGLYLPVVHDGRQEWLAPFEFVDGGVWGTTGRELYGANLAIGKLSGAWVEPRWPAPGNDIVHPDGTQLAGPEQQQSRQVRLLQSKPVPEPRRESAGPVGMVDGPARAQRLVVLGLRQYRDAAVRRTRLLPGHHPATNRRRNSAPPKPVPR